MEAQERRQAGVLHVAGAWKRRSDAAAFPQLRITKYRHPLSLFSPEKLFYYIYRILI
jgi:hypothetical protein